MVSSMSLKRKVLSICFLTLTIVSISFLSYTLYMTFGTSWAVRSLKVSLSDYSIKENGSKAYFYLVINNPSSIHLEVFFLRTKFYFNNNYIDQRERSFKFEPLSLPTNVETHLTIILQLGNQSSYSEGVWKLNLRFILETPLPQRGGHSTILEK